MYIGRNVWIARPPAAPRGRNVFAFFAVAGLIAVAGGLLVAFFRGTMEPQPDATLAARLAAFPTPEISGTIAGVSADSFTLDVPSVGGIPIPADSPLRRRRVTLTAESVITEKRYKTEEELIRERAAGGDLPPIPDVLLPLTFHDLGVGDMVRVMEKDYTFIQTKTDIVASHIIREARRGGNQ